MKQVAATDVSASQISDILGFSFVDAVHVSDNIGALKNFDAAVIPNDMTSTIHVEGASVEELKALSFVPDTYTISDSVQKVLAAKTEKLDGNLIIANAEVT